MGQQPAASDTYVNAKGTYRYPPWMGLANIVVVMAGCSMAICPLLVVSASSFGTSVASWSQFVEWVQNTGRILVFWSLPGLMGVMVSIHAYPDITVSPAGLETTVLFIIPVHIPWNEVLAFKKRAAFPSKHGTGIILVKRLTPWHRLLSPRRFS